MTTHGQSVGGVHTPEYKAYRAAKRRCTGKKTIGYANYGGRGIEFRFSSFFEFFQALGTRPTGTTIERIDNDGHYETGNVRWATRAEQRANRRRQKYTEQGKRKLSVARARKGRKNSPETLEKMRVAALARWARERAA